mmetsp:Transcript_38844/g.61520  ORF Transcript_38844/g.61520 Transcript_38844/m.61520 type:complete len:350 (-) Transcript_38844:26-1075(-)|eukprot:CAMPEP_0201522498 /NCGR_PEP_ID=MMETSP0161_2-20130828/17729_1 /ASSEMBLY_ACC=CAM_ASM_000251 /TAXON_ID=180227 /ORGANISM="Neoparamoeba aestuarina, Strain SoJaBio B1-5/56/2" /LENGTH=349 /DNA_ID=CAMNT_0047921355 /DNA_START=130 /DNA_END=1179 /DNA_ORIENTATION=+
MIDEVKQRHTYDDVLVFPYDGGQHRTGTQDGPDVVLNKTEEKNFRKMEVDHGDGYKLKDADEPILRERPFGTDFMWNSESLKKNTRLLYNTTSNYTTTDCFGLFGDHSMEGGFFMGNQRRLKKLGFNHHLIMMDAHGDSHHPSSSPSGNCHGMMMGSIVMGVELLYGSNPVHCLGQAGVDKEIEKVVLGKEFEYGGEIWLPSEPPMRADQLVMFGTCSLEPAERAILHEYKNQGARIYSPEDIEHLGVDRILTNIRENLRGDFPSIHISLDVDVTRGLRCTGTPEGLVEYDNVVKMLTGLVDTGKVRSGGMYEMNPNLRPERMPTEGKIWCDYYKIFMQHEKTLQDNTR